MNSGRLRKRLTIQSKTATRNSFGEEILSWGDVLTVWGSVEPLNAREYFQAQQLQSKVTHKVILRYMDGIRPDWRIKWGSRIFNILTVLNVGERNREMTLFCEEFVT